MELKILALATVALMVVSVLLDSPVAFVCCLAALFILATLKLTEMENN